MDLLASTLILPRNRGSLLRLPHVALREERRTREMRLKNVSHLVLILCCPTDESIDWCDKYMKCVTGKKVIFSEINLHFLQDPLGNLI